MAEIRYSILAVCFFDAPNPIYESFSKLGGMLRESNIELVICVMGGDFSQYTGFTAIQIPFGLEDHGRRFSNVVSATGLSLTGATLRELVNLNEEWFGIPGSPSVELNIQKAYIFWEKALEIVRPCAILSWGTTAPFSRLMLRLAQNFQIPVYVIERGWFEDTLCFEVLGQGPFNKSVIDINFLNVDEAGGYPQDIWHQISYYLSNTQSRHYHHFNQKGASDAVESAKSSPRRKILYIGSNDLGSGHGLYGVMASERYSTWVHSSAEACDRLLCAISDLPEDVELWYKPHPATPFTIESAPSKNVSVRKFEFEDIYELVEAADIVVTLGSSAQLYGYVYAKPVIVFGNSFMMGRDSYYRASSEVDLASALRNSLEEVDFPGKLARGRAVICAMFEHSFIGLNDEVPCQYRLSDLAKLLARLSQLAEGAAWESRMSSFMQLMDIASRQGAVDTLNAKIGHLELTNTEIANQLLELQQNMALLEADRDDITAARNQASGELDIAKGSIHRLSLELRAKEKSAKATLDEKMATHDQELSILSAQISTLKAEVEQARILNENDRLERIRDGELERQSLEELLSQYRKGKLKSYLYWALSQKKRP